MAKTVLRLLAFVAALVILYAGVVLVGAIGQVAAAADRVSLGLGQPVFWALLGIFAALAIAPVALYFRLPRPLKVPEASTGPEFDEYLRRLKAQLARNPLVAGTPLDTDEQVAEAIARLDKEANAVVRNTASAIFASTAVMQNGRLDALVVFASQVRMTYRIASIYYRRPSPRQMLYIYGNVGANVLVADNLQDVDFAGIVTPVVTAAIPSLKGAMPGLQGISTLLVNSFANGAANAFLTLRVGLIARDYCAALTYPDKARIRRSATSAALSMSAEIAREQGTRVAQAAWGAVTDAASSATTRGFKAVSGVIGGSWNQATGAVARIAGKDGARAEPPAKRDPGE
jgi:hypothetical protein